MSTREAEDLMHLERMRSSQAEIQRLGLNMAVLDRQAQNSLREYSDQYRQAQGALPGGGAFLQRSPYSGAPTGGFLDSPTVFNQFAGVPLPHQIPPQGVLHQPPVAPFVPLVPDLLPHPHQNPPPHPKAQAYISPPGVQAPPIVMPPRGPPPM